ncbi:hypothetical protein C1646_675446 [Rhizophagus diaphanus]|nr:hypothetical protein C1646_675446 [Rhizophagus diaphanus] [Rhizophagus sp. MUCL 43196]
MANLYSWMNKLRESWMLQSKIFLHRTRGVKASSICCESDIYYPEGKDSQIYVWNISQLWIGSKRGDSQQKNRKYENIGVESEFCSNIRRRIGLRLSFGELCRVGTFGIAKRTSEEIQCNYVYAKHEHKNGGDGPVYKMSESSGRNVSEGLGLSVSMVVYTFVDKSVRRNIAASIHITLIDNEDLERHDDFYGEVELKLKSNKRLDRVIWSAEYDGVMYQALPSMSKCIIIIGVKRYYFFY